MLRLTGVGTPTWGGGFMISRTRSQARPRRSQLAGVTVGTLALVLASFSVIQTASAAHAAPVPAAAAISFGKSLLSGEISTRPSTLQFGPDGRLYVAQGGMLVALKADGQISH